MLRSKYWGYLYSEYILIYGVKKVIKKSARYNHDRKIGLTSLGINLTPVVWGAPRSHGHHLLAEAVAASRGSARSARSSAARSEIQAGRADSQKPKKE